MDKTLWGSIYFCDVCVCLTLRKQMITDMKGEGTFHLLKITNFSGNKNFTICFEYIFIRTIININSADIFSSCSPRSSLLMERGWLFTQRGNNSCPDVFINCRFLCSCPFLAVTLTPAIPMVGGVLFFFVLGTLLRTSFSDPGVLPRATPEEAADLERQIGPLSLSLDSPPSPSENL